MTTPGWSHFRLVTLLSAILTLSGIMFIICIGVGLFGGINTFAFMAAEVSWKLPCWTRPTWPGHHGSAGGVYREILWPFAYYYEYNHLATDIGNE